MPGIELAEGEALDYLRQQETLPCLILLDHTMPRMTAVEFRKEQKKDPRLTGIPVVMLSAVSHSVAAKVGTDAFLRKPPRLSDLFATIARFCPHGAPHRVAAVR